MSDGDHQLIEAIAAGDEAAFERFYRRHIDASRGSVAGWLHRIVSNRLIDLRRGDSRREALAARMVERRVLEVDDIDRLAERIDAARSAPRVQAALRNLPESQREAVTLVGIDGLSATEAADQLGATPTAVRMRLVRARRAIQHSVGQEPETHQDYTEVLP